MELINYNKNDGLITIELSITGTPTWYYYYFEDQQYENDSTLGRPLFHTLGMPVELIKKAHHWEFRVANISNVSIDVDFEITWFQEVGVQRVKTLIHKWTKSCKIDADSGERVGSSALIVS